MVWIKVLMDILLVIVWSVCAVENLLTGSNMAGIIYLLGTILWAFDTGLDVAEGIRKWRTK